MIGFFVGQVFANQYTLKRLKFRQNEYKEELDFLQSKGLWKDPTEEELEEMDENDEYMNIMANRTKGAYDSISETITDISGL